MSALDLLAERYGIEASFRDAHGTMRITSAETRARLLHAMESTRRMRIRPVLSSHPWIERRAAVCCRRSAY